MIGRSYILWISRLRVNGGFLNGLDARFDHGLNVVIGPRGAGKTTLLELIRHAIGAEDADARREAQRKAQLSAVLGTGQVILDLEGEGESIQVLVDADGKGRRPDLAQVAVVLGQSELEDIASDAPSRLKLIDLRAGEFQRPPDRSALGKFTTQLWHLRQELDQAIEVSSRRSNLEADLEVLRSQEASLVGHADGPIASQRDQLRSIESSANFIARQLEAINTGMSAAESIRVKLEVAQTELPLLVYPEEAEQFADVRNATARLVDQVQGGIRSIDDALSGYHTLAAGLSEQLLRQEATLRETAAPLRSRLDEAEAGLGQLTAQIRNLEAQLQDIDDNDGRIRSLEERIAGFTGARDTEFARIESLEERLYAARMRVAQDVSRHVDSHIVVSIQHLSDTDEFRRVLQETLKGTHTRQTLIDSIAARTLPRLLLELLEGRRVDELASAGEMSLEQAGRLLSAFDSPQALAALAEVGLNDRADFLLRDGAVDKSVDTLSTGQKCAVTLPIILSEQGRTLVLDQPEDHLDNAYLVDHIVTGINHRTGLGVQTIVATHNANIPVLGSADRVFVLASDGERGHLVANGRFDEPDIVKAITSLMEGGPEAFRRRSEFYASHPVTL